MLEIVVPKSELYDESKQEFNSFDGQLLRLEHSLVSISKWESAWHKPFLTNNKKTYAESLDYIRCMTLTKNADPKTYGFLTDNNIQQINTYIEDSMTATTFFEKGSMETNREINTSELIYYWMIFYNIPVEFQKWHLNRLLTLVKICGIKNQPEKKRNKRDLMNYNASLNASRKKKLNTNG